MIWQFQSWVDPAFIWNPSEYCGLKEITVAASRVWIPEIMLYNRQVTIFLNNLMSAFKDKKMCKLSVLCMTCIYSHIPAFLIKNVVLSCLWKPMYGFCMMVPGSGPLSRLSPAHVKCESLTFHLILKWVLYNKFIFLFTNHSKLHVALSYVECCMNCLAS